jgi:hypothetical protein
MSGRNSACLRGQLRSETPYAEGLVHGAVAGTNIVTVLHNDNSAIERARAAIRARLDR